MYAHYTATKTVKFVTLSSTMRPDSNAMRHIVTNKKEARAVAATHNATPWNF